MELASLLVKIGITGVSSVESGLRQVDRAVDATARKSHAAGLEFGHYRAPLLEAAGAAGLLASNMAQVGALVAGASGIGVAARFQKLEGGFANILGSVQQARDLMKEMRALGASTEFNTEELIGYSRVLLATGSTAKGVVRELRAVADAAAFAGLSTADAVALALNLSQIRQAPRPELEDLKQFGTRGLSLDKIVGAAQGKTLASGEGIKILKGGMSGQQAFDTIITGMEKAFGGSAARNAGTLLGIVQNLNEAFSTAMLPTGKLLVPLLTTVAGGIKSVGESLGRINEVTGGGAGLVIMLTALWRTKNLLIGSIVTAVTATRALTTALQQYAGTAAATRAIPPAVFAPGVQAGLSTPQGASNRIGGAFGIRGAISAAGGVLPLLKQFGGKALGFLGKSGIGGIIASLGLGFLGDKVGGKTGGALGGIGTGIGIGSLIGSIVPGIGTAVGAAVGGLIGGIAGYFNSADKPKASDPVAENTKQMAATLKDIHGELIGGGKRGRRVVGELEIEAIFGRAMATGIG